MDTLVKLPGHDSLRNSISYAITDPLCCEEWISLYCSQLFTVMTFFDPIYVLLVDVRSTILDDFAHEDDEFVPHAVHPLTQDAFVWIN